MWVCYICCGLCTAVYVSRASFAFVAIAWSFILCSRFSVSACTISAASRYFRESRDEIIEKKKLNISNAMGPWGLVLIRNSLRRS